MITARTKTYAHFIFQKTDGEPKCLWRDVLGWNDEGEPMIYSYSDHMLVSARMLYGFAGVEFDNSIECGHTTDIWNKPPLQVGTKGAPWPKANHGHLRQQKAASK